MDTGPQTLHSNFPAPYNQAVDHTGDHTSGHTFALLQEIPLCGAQTSPDEAVLWLRTSLVGRLPALLGKLLGSWHLASLDAPTVAVCWSLALARVSGARLPLWAPVALGLGTWSIYLGDRLMDAKRALAPLRERHWFHWQHRRVLLPAAILSLVAALALVLRNMPPAIRARDAVLALAAAVYFVAIHSRSSLPTPEIDPEIDPGIDPETNHPTAFSIHSQLNSKTQPSAAARVNRLFLVTRLLSRLISKETFVGLIFALVCAAPAATRAPGSFAVLILPVAACFLLAWLNCWLIERWDAGRKGGTRRQFALALAAGSSALLSFAVGSPQSGLFLLAIAASALLLAWLDRHRSRLAALQLRAAADLVLLTPLLSILLAPLLRGGR